MSPYTLPSGLNYGLAENNRTIDVRNGIRRHGGDHAGGNQVGELFYGPNLLYVMTPEAILTSKQER